MIIEPPTTHNEGGHLTPLVLIASWRRESEWPKRLADSVDPARPIIWVPPPSADRIDQYPNTAEEWAEQMLAVIEPVLPDGPYTVGGWSFGGVLASLVGEMLADRYRRPPARLFLLDAAMPVRHAKPDNRWQVIGETLGRVSEEITACAEADHPTRAVADRVKVSATARFRRAYEELRGSRTEKPRVKTVRWSDGDQASMLKRAVWVCYLKYRPRPLVSAVSLVACDESVERWGITLGWHSVAHDDLEVIRVPGRHTTLFDDDTGADRIFKLVEGRCAEIDLRERTAASEGKSSVGRD